MVHSTFAMLKQCILCGWYSIHTSTASAKQLLPDRTQRARSIIQDKVQNHYPDVQRDERYNTVSVNFSYAVCKCNFVLLFNALQVAMAM